MGRKPTSPEHKKATGETRPSRQVVDLFPSHSSRPDPDVIDPPTWMKAPVKKIWAAKVERYRQRGQKVDGFQDSLAQYCQLEWELVDLRKKGMVPPMSMVTQYRGWAAEFYDTPASQKVAAGGGAKQANRFGSNGQRARS